MKSARVSRELMALLPWLAAALVWVGLVTPMRADQGLRLRDQASIRQNRVKAERRAREVQSLRGRISAAVEHACRASTDPAAVRQRVIAATADLALSPFSLTVTGGPGAGASVEAQGSQTAISEMLRRIGDPGRGSFLRSATVRERGGVYTLSAQTGVVDSIPAGFAAPLPACEAAAPSPVPTPSVTPLVSAPRRPRVAPMAAPSPSPLPAATPAPPPPPPTPPFTLVAFLESSGRVRASLRIGSEIRVVAAGDQVSGWRCVAIDRDEGVEFVSAAGVRATLRAVPSPH